MEYNHYEDIRNYIVTILERMFYFREEIPLDKALRSKNAGSFKIS